MTGWTPIAPQRIADLVADRVAGAPGIVRVAVDGPPCAEPDAFAARLVEPLRLRGRPVAHVRATAFWRDAALRLEHGRQDVESYPRWLDAAALRREVLDAAVHDGSYLPSLRDPVTNRSTREPARPVSDGQVIVVSGAFLLGLELPFDVTVHLALSPAARSRRTREPDAWTLPAFDRYDATVRPAQRADVVIKLDDPRHPALRGPAVAP